MNKPLLIAALVFAATLIAGCTLKSDAQYSADQSRRANERAAESMKLSTQQTARGTALTTATLMAAISGKTLINRYDKAPPGLQGPYVVQRHFAPDGQFILVEAPTHYVRPPNIEDRWRVDGDQLCIKGPPNPHRWECYRMARAADGALQWYVDDATSPANKLLTIVTREIFDGPPKK